MWSSGDRGDKGGGEAAAVMASPAGVGDGEGGEGEGGGGEERHPSGEWWGPQRPPAGIARRLLRGESENKKGENERDGDAVE